jgi:hypothetical protein
MLSSTWKPQGKLWVEGYRGVVTQLGFGMLSNWIGEFAPEIRGKLRIQNHSERYRSNMENTALSVQLVKIESIVN